MNEAVVLQQLHFRLLISNNVRDGYKWGYKTYEEWKNDEFPSWSFDTIKRAIRRLEVKGFIIATASYNRMKMDKTKWYRIDYQKLQLLTEQHAMVTTAQLVTARLREGDTVVDCQKVIDAKVKEWRGDLRW